MILQAGIMFEFRKEADTTLQYDLIFGYRLHYNSFVRKESVVKPLGMHY